MRLGIPAPEEHSGAKSFIACYGSKEPIPVVRDQSKASITIDDCRIVAPGKYYHEVKALNLWAGKCPRCGDCG